MSKTVIITGATGNLGGAVTEAFITAGYKVIGTIEPGKRRDENRDTGHLKFMEVDLADEAKAAAFIDEVHRAEGEISACVMLVGGFAMADIASTTGEDISKMITLNFNTAYHTARPVLDIMKLQSTMGCLVFVGAKPALNPAIAGGVTAYALSKSMVIQFANIINGDAKTHNATATVVVPSIIDTPPNRASMPDANFDDWVKPEKIASTILFACSEEGSELRGSVLKVYGNS
ncbi:MAG: SDR family NAD(P)-dependent oxidoreductase [Cyclobacteriaceae bacterium]